MSKQNEIGRKANQKKIKIDRASPAEVKAAIKRQAKREGVTPAELMAREVKATERMSASGTVSASEIVGRIMKRDAQRRACAKYPGVKVAVIMPDGSMTTAPLSDYGFEQLFLDVYGEGETPADNVRGSIEANEDAPIEARTRKRAASYYRKHERPARCVEFTDDGQAVTIRVGGRAYANLAKIASALNALSLADDDNSPASVLNFWVGSLLWRIETTPEEDATNSVADLVFDIVDGIDTGADDGTPEDASRRAELKAALQAIKF